MAEQKLGLALSGGGFRASLFHIGLLARLAELDRLKDVEVISTVSGGSILGAYYYLKVKELLEARRDDSAPPSKDAFVKIVKEVEKDFLAAVQKNLRMRALWNPYKNARMLLSDDYSSSDRMSELYDKHLYLPLWRGMGFSGKDILLKEIGITPAVDRKGFDPAGYKYKVPRLVINATTLNTGHSWHFTASKVGEPGPKSANSSSIDNNFRCIELEFDKIGGTPEEDGWSDLPDLKRRSDRDAMLNSITLADAVAASACVPGIFTPLALHDLYWSKSTGRPIVVELVDGGVYDNQGIDALYTEHCSDFICSDASGQLEDELAPSSGALSVALRSNGVMMDRIRDDGYYDLYQCERGDKLLDVKACADAPVASGLEQEWDVDKFAFFHLREKFEEQPGYPAIPGPTDRATDTTGGVYRLSNIRTDLDSFSDIEAYSLMYDGYGLSNKYLFEGGLSTDESLPDPIGKDPWRFLEIREMLGEARLAELLKHLKVGSHQFFKVFLLGNPLAIAIAAALVLALAGLAYHFRSVSFGLPFTQVSVGAIAILALIVTVIWILKKLETTHWLGVLLEKIRRYRRWQWLALLYAALGVVLIVVWAVVTLHLYVFDWLFLSSGRIRRQS